VEVLLQLAELCCHLLLALKASDAVPQPLMAVLLYQSDAGQQLALLLREGGGGGECKAGHGETQECDCGKAKHRSSL
jgi:hypothetical protein